MSELPTLNRYLNRIPRLHAIDRNLEQAGAEITVIRFICVQALITLTLLLKLNTSW